MLQYLSTNVTTTKAAQSMLLGSHEYYSSPIIDHELDCLSYISRTPCFKVLIVNLLILQYYLLS
jgi:hypothetical protein